MQAIATATPQSGPSPYAKTGLLRVVSNTEMVQAESAARAAEEANNQPEVQALAAYVRRCFDSAARERQETEARMYRSLRARRGEYDPMKLAAIREMGGSEIYMMLTSVKCRAASSWLRDVYLGQGNERAWSVSPTPEPKLAPVIEEMVTQQIMQEAAQVAALGVQLQDENVIRRIDELREEVTNAVYEQARRTADRAQTRIEDELVEGGFFEAFSEFLDDLTVYPTAIFKGPVIRKKRRMQWVQGANGWEPQEQEVLVKTWERVDPLNFYPAPYITDVNDGYCVELVQLTRTALSEFKGTPGCNDAAIDAIIEEYGRGGLREWTTADAAKQVQTESVSRWDDSEPTVDALFFSGAAQGQDLIDWGMKDVTDPNAMYDVDVWMIGRWVFKATLNNRPAGQKIYYTCSYEKLPGSFWGNSVADIIADIQDVLNACARALVNNMGIASGPQVWVNAERLPPGENITKMFPWKIWQGTSDPMGSTADGIQFFQPQPMVQELLTVFEKFSVLADDYSGIPRYMSGSDQVSGAARTASGLSMLINNAGKAIKQVAGNIDRALTRMLELHYFYLMKYDPDLSVKGDLQIRARGAAGIVAKEAVQLRRNEFLTATANPVDMQIMGAEGRSALLREAARGLDMNPDDIVPTVSQQARRNALAAAQQAAMAPPPGANQEQLGDGTPTTDNFSPNGMRQPS